MNTGMIETARGSSDTLNAVSLLIGVPMVGPQIHWEAVADAINTRLPEVQMTQQDLATAAHVSLTTVRDLRNNRGAQRRGYRTLAAISEALGWPAGTLDAVARGQETAELSLEERVARLEGEVADLRTRVESTHSDHE